MKQHKTGRNSKCTNQNHIGRFYYTVLSIIPQINKIKIDFNKMNTLDLTDLF